MVGGAASIAQDQPSERPPIFERGAIHHPEVGRAGMVVSQNAIAAEIGAYILEQGGNAVDAAVATGFALAVTLPRAGNLGGGGFMLIYLAETGETVAIDYREKAPASASRDMYLDANGDVDQQKVRFSHHAAGVPGSVAGLTLALEKYGTMSLAEVLEPARSLAEGGFIVSFEMAEALGRARQRLSASEASLKKFYKADGSNYEAGDLFRQPDLANTLQLIQQRGRAAFYEGEIARLIIAEMERAGAPMTLADLAAYEPVLRKPVRGTYRGYEIVSMPPPSSGGIHIIQMLNILERFPIGDTGFGSAATIHLMIESMRRAYADRSLHLGDPDYYDVPAAWITSKAYGRQLAAQITAARASRSVDVLPGEPAPYESPDTTHFSVMDRFGNAVANTYTLNFSYGSGITVPGAGFLLNNEMDDFSAKAGVPNAFGLLGGTANQIEPGKRPLSSMTPTMVMKDGKPYFITGSPGGSTIITAVLQTIVNVIDHNMNVADAIHAPRFHHQWQPDMVFFENRFSADTLQLLQQRGHQVQVGGAIGAVQGIMYKDGLFYGASDPRRPFSAAVGVCVEGQLLPC